MNPHDMTTIRQRRRFLAQTACGLGTIALADLLSREGRTDSSAAAPAFLTPRPPHHRPRAKNVIFLFMAGGPSHLDLFDPKPGMRRLHGKPVPASFLEGLDDP